MLSNYVFNNASSGLPVLAHDVLRSPEVGSRNGRTKEMTHVGITLTKPWQRELLVPVRRPNLAAQIAETMWVLAGRNDIEWLSRYLPRAGDFSDDGKTWRAGYGPRMRNYRGATVNSVVHPGVDQLAYVVETLRKDPLSRQAVIQLWDPVIDNTPGKDRACNVSLNFTSRLGALDLHVFVRSNDLFWGWSGINAFEWSALLEIVAGLIGVKVGHLHFSTTSLHLYDQHWDKAHRMVRAANTITLSRMEDSPRFNAGVMTLKGFDNLVRDWFYVEELIRTRGDHEDAVNLFPEPMLRSWLRVIQWWWTGDEKYLAPLKGTRLFYAADYAIQPDIEKPEPTTCPKCGTKMTTSGGRTPLKCIAASCNYTPSQDGSSDFITYVTKLHDEKDKAYGDSWKRRGEMLGILANIARKVDRLEHGGETSDETKVDTAIDAMVYLAKYRVWLSENNDEPVRGYTLNTKSTTDTNVLLTELDKNYKPTSTPDFHLVRALVRDLDVLENRVKRDINRASLVENMLVTAHRLARRSWEQEQRADAPEEYRQRFLTGADEYRGADVD